MKKSNITFEITLDSENIPENIYWDATEKQPRGLEKTKAFCLSIWDSEQHNTLKIDLWTKDMPVIEMKRFYVETIGGLTQSLLSSTGDEYMTSELNMLCDKLGKYVEEESKKEGQ